MNIRRCINCGENLTDKGGVLSCSYCGATFDKSDEVAKLEEILEAHKQDLLANRRRVLWQEAHKPNPSKTAILRAAMDVREIVDEDDLATFYFDIHQDDLSALYAYLSERKVPKAVAEEVVRFALPSLNARMTLPLKTFVERHFKGEDYFARMSQIEKEADKLDDGMYMTSLPRDVFLAYSSKDMDKVTEMADFLESEGFSVFCALRNLRHGAGSAEFYLSGLQDAMKHCKAFVFLSSIHSRSTDCDALSAEIPYLLDNLPGVKRVHYRLDDEGQPKIAASILLKEFDSGREWCRSKEDLIARLIAREPAVQQAETPKYPKVSEYDDDGFLVIHEGQPGVGSDHGRLVSFKGHALKVRLGEDFHTIDRQAFKESIGLTELDLGPGVKTLNTLAFNGTIKLQRILGGDNVEKVEEGAFAGTPDLKEVHNPSSGAYVSLPDATIRDGSKKRVMRYLGQKNELAESDFAGVETIDAGAYAYNHFVYRVSLPKTIKSVGNGAFANCAFLRTLMVSGKIPFVGKYAFAKCNELCVYVSDASSRPAGWSDEFAGQTQVIYRNL